MISRKRFGLAALVLGVLVLVAIAAAAMPLVGLPSVKEWWKNPESTAESSSAGEAEGSAELVPGQKETLRLSPAVVKKLGIRIAEVKELLPSGKLNPPHRAVEQSASDGWTEAEVKEAEKSRILHFPGSLALDTNNLAPVRSRFPGEVVQIGTTQDRSNSLETISRPLRYGDRVSRGQLLVVVWNTDLGTKKNDLVDALTQLRLDQQQLGRVEEAYRKGAQSDVQLDQARHNIETSLNRVAAVEATLRTWRVPKEEIDAVKEEAQRIAERKGRRDPEKEETWPRVEMRAPFDGVIVEKTVGLHSYVDTSTDLFKIANLEKLSVYANAYEEDLPALQALKQEQRRWQIRLQSDPTAKPLPGIIDVIGYTIDPTQHTALIIGQIDNREERFRAGQFIIADVAVSPQPNEVVIPTMALVEDGRESVIFVQPDPGKPYYRQMRVDVARREREVVFLRARSGEPQGPAMQPSHQEAPLKPGQTWVVSSGSVELKAALEDLQSRARQK